MNAKQALYPSYNCILQMALECSLEVFGMSQGFFVCFSLFFEIGFHCVARLALNSQQSSSSASRMLRLQV